MSDSWGSDDNSDGDGGSDGASVFVTRGRPHGTRGQARRLPCPVGPPPPPTTLLEPCVIESDDDDDVAIDDHAGKTSL